MTDLLQQGDDHAAGRVLSISLCTALAGGCLVLVLLLVGQQMTPVIAAIH